MGTISKVTAGGATHLIASSAYGICSTAAATAAKTVNFTDDQAFTLIQGETIHIKFTNTNTVASPTLNVKGTGAKPIHRIGGTAAGTTVADSWAAGEIVSLTYDTTQISTGCWIINSGHKYTASTTSIGSASVGTAIAADDITAYTAGTAATLTHSTVNTLNRTKTVLGSTDLTSLGSVTLYTGTITDGVGTNSTVSKTNYKLDLSNLAKSYGNATASSISAWTTNTPTSVTYTARSIPNISVSSRTVATGISAS